MPTTFELFLSIMMRWSQIKSIPECPGVYANAPTLEECRGELAEVLEDWLLFRIYKNLPLPKMDGIELTVKKEMAA